MSSQVDNLDIHEITSDCSGKWITGNTTPRLIYLIVPSYREHHRPGSRQPAEPTSSLYPC